MLTLSSSSLPPTVRRAPILRRQFSSELYRPRTILIEKTSTSASYGFSIQTYGFAALNLLSNDESACSLLSLSSESLPSRQSSTSNSSSLPLAPIQLVTYVDHVQDKGPAWEAGLRSGSVILAVNDHSVEHDDHETLVKRITQTSSTQLKLVIIQQNVNRQIALCEQLQQLHKELHDKEEELEELCKQERTSDKNPNEINSPSPRLQHPSSNPPERTSSFCHDKIPLDWRQSVTNFAHQQNLTVRTLPPVLSSTLSITSSKYTKHRPCNRRQSHQRSMSLSTIVFHYSKSTLLRHQPPPPSSSSLAAALLSSQGIGRQHRRALSFEQLFSSEKFNSNLSNDRQDHSVLASGCSLAMDLTRCFDRENVSLSSSSSSTINTDDDEQSIENKRKPFKWKLRISQ